MESGVKAKRNEKKGEKKMEKWTKWKGKRVCNEVKGGTKVEPVEERRKDEEEEMRGR